MNAPENESSAEERESTKQLLTFRVGDEVYALEVTNAREILEYTTETVIPHLPPWIRGVINLRGTIVPVVDLATKLGMPSQERTIDTCIIIVELHLDGELFLIGALVDAVQEVFEVEDAQLEPPPSFGTKVSTELIRAIGTRNDRMFIVLDAERAFTSSELDALQAAHRARTSDESSEPRAEQL